MKKTRPQIPAWMRMTEFGTDRATRDVVNSMTGDDPDAQRLVELATLACPLPLDPPVIEKKPSKLKRLWTRLNARTINLPFDGPTALVSLAVTLLLIKFFVDRIIVSEMYVGIVLIGIIVIACAYTFTDLSCWLQRQPTFILPYRGPTTPPIEVVRVGRLLSMSLKRNAAQISNIRPEKYGKTWPQNAEEAIELIRLDMEHDTGFRYTRWVFEIQRPDGERETHVFTREFFN